MTNVPVLELDRVSVSYVTEKGLAKAVDDVSLTIYEKEVVGLVGESGCGKSTLATAIMRLLGSGAYLTNGQIRVMGQDVYSLSAESLRQFRWSQMSMVFQGAMNVLNPVMTIDRQIVDTLRAHTPQMTKREALARAEELFRLVRIDPSRLRSYPHELSGGMRQRVVIAIAVALSPKLVIMDEPTTALDVVVQRSIMEQIMQLQQQLGFSILLISHDFNLVADVSQRVGVMYAGRLIELTNSSPGLLAGVHHPYTQGLIHAVPSLRGERVPITGIKGSPPSIHEIPTGCPFQPRCAHAVNVCAAQPPASTRYGQSTIACHLTSEQLGALHYG